ncbi:MAG: pyridoxal-phosphate dependent enzyme [Candidatus Babeliales bacterium]|nr:pyridoxal-phosphate dependent enzyme [Candidatus Babeliales bacterium]
MINKILFSIFLINFINAELPLFKKFPTLKDKIAYVSFCDLPTPTHKLEKLCKHLDHQNIYIKRDDLSGLRLKDATHLFGGNKPRKLEFLLADAQKQNAKTIVTYGCAGSNHALATAVYANHLGLNSILMLKSQPNSKAVRHNLLLDKFYNAQFQFYPNNQVRSVAAQKLLSQDNTAYFFPTGGSIALGAVAFVNAIFELKEQIDNAVMPEPDVIYLPINSCGTTAGLLLGIKAAQLKTKIIAVAVEPEEVKDQFENETKKLFLETNTLLNSLDKNFGMFAFPETRFNVNKKFCGVEYGLFTKEAVEAKKTFKQLEGIALDGTYSSKAMVALMDDVRNNKKTVVLFWNTYCGIDYSNLTNSVDYKELPEEFHKYYCQDVQELDKN